MLCNENMTQEKSIQNEKFSMFVSYTLSQVIFLSYNSLGCLGGSNSSSRTVLLHAQFYSAGYQKKIHYSLVCICFYTMCMYFIYGQVSYRFIPYYILYRYIYSSLLLMDILGRGKNVLEYKFQFFKALEPFLPACGLLVCPCC